MEKHSLWDNRASFILASMGSAIGLGNVWRFPYLAYKYGGGAFLIPYLIALATAGIPILILEFALGHKMRASAPGAFYKVRKGTEWVGWFALLVGFAIVSYYVIIMAWSGRYLIASFTLEWGTTKQAIEGFFYNKVLSLSPGPLKIGKFVWPLAGLLVVMWVWVLASIWQGAKTASKVVWVTVTTPWVILLIFMIRGLTLPGAMEGLKYFLTPNFAALANPEVWQEAYGQIFFSLSVGFGVMIAYASFLPRKAEIVNNAILVGLADTGTAFVAGIAVFSCLGYYAHETGQQVANVVASGPGLAFVTYPLIINKLPLAPVFGVLFFIMLLTIAVDSAFSLVEGVAPGIMDRFKFKRVPTLIGLGVIALIIGLIFITGSGLYWLDIADHFTGNFGLILASLVECVVIGWMWRSHHLRRYSNLRSEVKIGLWWEGMIQWVAPAVIIFLISFAVIKQIKTPYGNYPPLAEFLGGWLLIGVVAELSIILTHMEWRKKIPALLVAPIIISAFYGLRFTLTGSKPLLFIILWWVGVALLIEAAIILRKMPPRRKIVALLIPPGILAAVSLIVWATSIGKPEWVVLIIACLIIYGGILLSVGRTILHRRKVKRGEIRVYEEKEE